MRCSTVIPALILVLAGGFSRTNAADAPKAPAAPAKAGAKAEGAAARAPLSIGKTTPAQADAIHAARAKLDIAPGDPPAAAPAAGVLTYDQLFAMLDAMGYEPKTSTYTDGSKYATVVIQRNGWTFNMTLDISPSTTWVWMHAYLMEWTEAQQAAAPRLLKLLTQNYTQWPSYFTFFSGRMLYMERPLANSGIKPAALRAALEAHMNAIQATQPDWDTRSWTEAAPAAAPAPSGGK